MSFTFNLKVNNLFFCMAVPKKRTSISKKRIRRNIWRRKGYWAAVKAFSLAKSISTGYSKGFFVRQKK
nr:ribosomal protein L32 [Euryale ferox]